MWRQPFIPVPPADLLLQRCHQLCSAQLSPRVQKQQNLNPSSTGWWNKWLGWRGLYCRELCVCVHGVMATVQREDTPGTQIHPCCKSLKRLSARPPVLRAQLGFEDQYLTNGVQPNRGIQAPTISWFACNKRCLKTWMLDRDATF